MIGLCKRQVEDRPPTAYAHPATIKRSYARICEMPSDLRFLLDQSRLNGTYGVRRVLGPPLLGLLVDSFDDGIAAITESCQWWGGAVNPLLPLTSRKRLPARWKHFADETSFDALEARGKFSARRTDFEERVLGRKLGHGYPDHLLATVAFSGEDTDRWTPVAAALPPRDNPWFMSYVSALGRWPEQPDPRLLDWAHLSPGLQWADAFPVEFSLLASAGPDDLLKRLRESAQSPAQRSTVFLGVARAGRHDSIADDESRIPYPRVDARLIGPNIVVLYTPESLQDLCLVWALRAAHGLPRGLPLAVPDSEDVGTALSLFQSEHAGEHFGLGGDRRWALASLSIPIARLREVAAIDGNRWRAVRVEEILQSPSRAGRESSAFATFVEGEARIETWNQEDRGLVGSRPRGAPDFGLTVNLQLEDRVLPRSVSLTGRFPYDGYYYDGGWHLSARRHDSGTRPMRWPSGWTVIRALARDRGLDASPSAAGAAAATFLRQLRGHVAPLLLPELVATLHELAERRGMTWFRARAREIASEVAQADQTARLDRVDERLQSLSLRPFEDEGRELTFATLRRVLGTASQTGAWLEWALDASILVQGISVSCTHCGATSWRSVNELTPPIVCRGCAAPVRRPLPVNQLEFRFRASEGLLRLVDSDALSHVLALRWWCEYFSSAFRRSYLYGAFPGVEFKRRGSSETIGEADVLLVFTDGSLVAGECKRGPIGLNETELGKLDRLSAALDSSWDFVATIAPGRECSQVWRDLAERDSSRPRLVLTGDQLFDALIMRQLGADEFAWRGDSETSERERGQVWRQQLVMLLSHLGEERDPDAELLLDYE